MVSLVNFVNDNLVSFAAVFAIAVFSCMFLWISYFSKPEKSVRVKKLFWGVTFLVVFFGTAMWICKGVHTWMILIANHVSPEYLMRLFIFDTFSFCLLMFCYWKLFGIFKASIMETLPPK
jgi:hypothetical protein